MAETKALIALPEKRYNGDQLDAELRAALGEGVSGVQRGGGIYYAVLNDLASEGAEAIVHAVAEAHDDTQLTPQQLESAANAQRLEDARQKIEAADVKAIEDVRTVADLAAVVEVLNAQLTWALSTLQEVTGKTPPEKKNRA